MLDLEKKMMEEYERHGFEMEKIEKARKCLAENPGLVELLDLIKFMSSRPGGW